MWSDAFGFSMQGRDILEHTNAKRWVRSSSLYLQED